MAIGAWVETPLYIGGEERTGRETLAVHAPHDQSLVGCAAAASAQDADEALAEDLDARAEVLSREHGRTRFEATIDLHLLVGGFQEAARYTRKLDTEETVAGPPYRTTIRHVPQGVVTIIYPFNWPPAILAASLPHALMASNTVIAKPPPTAALSSVLTLRKVAALLPPGGAQRRHRPGFGDRACAGRRSAHQARLLHGSTAGGNRIMQIASGSVTNVTLELGGNDPAVLLDDLNLDQATIASIGMATFMTTGQVCMAIKRLYVPRALYGQVVDGPHGFIERRRIGPGLRPEVPLGPLNMRRAARLRDRAAVSGPRERP